MVLMLIRFSSALTAFDYLLTLHLEISEIWTGKLNIVKFLFIANRYPFYLAQIVTLFGRFFSVATDAVSAILGFSNIVDIDGSI